MYTFHRGIVVLTDGVKHRREMDRLESKIEQREPLTNEELGKVRKMLQLQRDFEAYGRLGRIFLFISAVTSGLWVIFEWWRRA